MFSILRELRIPIAPVRINSAPNTYGSGPLPVRGRVVFDAELPVEVDDVVFAVLDDVVALVVVDVTVDGVVEEVTLEDVVAAVVLEAAVDVAANGAVMEDM